MNRKKALLLIASSYNNKKKKKKKSFNLLKFLLKRLIIFISLKIFLITIGIILLFLPIIIIIFVFFGLSNNDGPKYLFQGDYGDYSYYFTQELIDIPIGIPVEKGRLTYGFDYNVHFHPIVNRFIKLTFGNEYYPGHAGIDFGRTYTDMIKFYNPDIISTSRGIVYQYEDYTINGNFNEYKRYKLGNNNEYLLIESSLNRQKEWDYRPYGKHVITSTIDGRFYIMYAHLDGINYDVLKNGTVERGDTLGKMGNTGRSTGTHLHYEIRYCGEENDNINKEFRNCKPINPLGFIGNNDFTYLGISSLPKNNNFTAGNIQIDKLVKKEEDIKETIIKEKETFCTNFNLYFVGKNITCNDIFPLYYSFKDGEIFPIINTFEEKKEASILYLEDEYNIKNINDLNKEKINEISNLEGLGNIENKDIFIEKLGNKLSFGKFLNKKSIYLKKDINYGNKDEINNLELKMLLDSIDYLDKLKKGNDIESIYNIYFYNPYYIPKTTNPYIYNFIDKNSLFLDIKDINGEFVEKYNKDGLMTIINKIN